MTKMKFLALAVVALLSANRLHAEDKKKVDNPEFTGWSKLKAGTVMTMKMVSETAGIKTEMTMATKLLEVKDDKAVVETETTSKVNGMEFKAPGQKRDVPKVLETASGPTAPGAKPPGTVDEGTETLKLGGTEYKCKWYKTKTEVMGIKAEAQIWMCDDVPGMMVKMVSKADKSETTMELVEIKKP
jgi:hypothetical protein